jgi:hypothetical protein
MMNSNDIKRAAIIAGGGVIAWGVERLVEYFDDRSDIPTAILLGGFVGWMVYQIVRNRKQPLDPLKVKYGRFNGIGIMTMLVIRVIVVRVAKPDVTSAISMAFLAAWFIVVDFLYRKEAKK